MIRALFLHHPESVDETYVEHMKFAGTFAFWLVMAAGAALIHAVVPALCESTASRIVARLYKKTASRGGTAL